MIRLVNVSKVYDNGVTALSNVNINIKAGDFVFLVGPSGAGKTTIIKLLLKEIEPTSGDIFVNDKNITVLKRREIPYFRRNIGVVFQDFRLLPDRNVYDNIAFAMQVVGTPSKEIRRRVPLMLSLVNLSSKAYAYPNELSGGEQQRVALARAIANNPPVLIADEPTGNLDPDTGWDIVNLLSEINRRGTTVIMATHAKEIVDAMRKRVIILKKGTVISDQEKGVYLDEVK
ncbi:cell division ATP-binding protein FtsE [Mahella australiensis]|uniref:Cell division ATP-binding protein FtsE n=1 Tax=Mahella australiensis (strain DSM 15567 / CIP 107919 / 50-1 BON) TaxID=697281 RepID=F4A0I1_MAHA5|nr:cell division ATP-binding protein FtsE [Mahella australiensis]AEE95860.1 cell division ATP-binding protein FtsE [Mahella australiensis 50-1 BON]